MKKVMLMIAFVAGIGTIASAQTRQHKTPQQRAEAMTNRLNEKLKLTADQSARVNSILLAQAASIDSLKAAAPQGDKKGNRGAFKSVFENTDRQLSTVLNAEQQKAYAALKTERKGKIKDGFKAHRKHKAPEERAAMVTKKLEKKLNLSADQSAKVSAILLAQATRMDSLKANKAQGDRTKNHAAFKGIRQNTDEQLSAVFNADQKKAYEEMKAARKEKMKERRGAAVQKAG
ncbi:hypothetical protein [Mucilaginibacter hurinus]|nr:hypothetical protein [Mucilaginibacter hurinus]